MSKYVIIGGGIAGTSAAEELRKLKPNAEITIISDEEHPLYSRVMLPMYVSGKVPRERLFLKNKEWYAKNNIDLLFDSVVEIDPEEKAVTTEQDVYLHYDKLLIAGGGKKRELDLGNDVYGYQTIEDSDKLVELKRTLESIDSPTIGIIGGGFIAMEFVKLFAPLGHKMKIFMRRDRFFSSLLDAKGSEILEHHLASKEIEIHKNTSINKFDSGVAQDNHGGSHPLDALCVGIGLCSNFEWAQEAGIHINNGIIVNSKLETSIEDVYAAGSCTVWPNPRSGKPHKSGNWANSQMQGKHAAKTMTGSKENYDFITSRSLDIVGMDIVGVCQESIDLADEVIERGDEQSRALLFVNNGKLVGASILNRSQDRPGVLEMIKSEKDISSIKDKLADPQIDIKTLL